MFPFPSLLFFFTDIFGVVAGESGRGGFVFLPFFLFGCSGEEAPGESALDSCTCWVSMTSGIPSSVTDTWVIGATMSSSEELNILLSNGSEISYSQLCIINKSRLVCINSLLFISSALNPGS